MKCAMNRSADYDCFCAHALRSAVRPYCIEEIVNTIGVVLRGFGTQTPFPMERTDSFQVFEEPGKIYFCHIARKHFHVRIICPDPFRFAIDNTLFSHALIITMTNTVITLPFRRDLSFPYHIRPRLNMKSVHHHVSSINISAIIIFLSGARDFAPNR